MEFASEIQGKRVTLKHTSNDPLLAKKLFTMIIKNKAYIAPWLEWVNDVHEVNDTIKYLERAEEKRKTKEAIAYVIYLKDEPIGLIQLRKIREDHKSGEISYYIAKEHSKGYGTESLHLLEQELFEHSGLNRIVLRCDEDNIGSKRIIEKNKYILEGTARKELYSTHFKDFRNILVYAKLQTDYNKEQ